MKRRGDPLQPIAGAGLAEALARVATDAAAEPDLHSTLDRITHGAAETVPDASEAHIAVVEGGIGSIVAATAPVIHRPADV